MKFLLVSTNSSYMHTSLAVRCLKVYADKAFALSENSDGENSIIPEIEYAEFTINQPYGDILRGIEASSADAVLFSTYIWNAEFVCKIIPDVKKILPNCVIGAGGPEFGYGAEKYLKSLSSLDFIMHGEGERTFVELCRKLCGSKTVPLNNGLSDTLSGIPGVFCRAESESGSEKILYTGDRPLIENLDEIPFSYPEIVAGNFDPDHKIYYYESSRGCPFSCAYCLSSVDKRVRFRSLERVFEELQIFLDAGIKLVKFVDRTYNLNPERYIKIWQYILDHHNGKTMFHFEIEAEYLSEEALEFLQKVPSGVMQFEMGVQSANKKTLNSINRSENIEKLAENIRRIPRTIHQHLDLIAGLPYENLESFGQSFDFVMNLRPDALQLGFLKVLHGTQMESYAVKNGWQWMENPVYETFSTPYLSYKDVVFLKDIEICTDVFWNKGTFKFTMEYIFGNASSWRFLCAILEVANNKKAFSQARRENYWFEFLHELFCSDESVVHSEFPQLNREILKDLLRYDFIRSGKKGNFPVWYERHYSKESHLSLLEQKEVEYGTKIGFAASDYDEFDYEVASGNYRKKKIKLLFLYK